MNSCHQRTNDIWEFFEIIKVKRSCIYIENEKLWTKYIWDLEVLRYTVQCSTFKKVRWGMTKEFYKLGLYFN